jgi:hypothetical protein
LDPSPPKPPRKDDTRIPIERLLDDLKDGKGNCKSKGWRRKEKAMYKGANDPLFNGPMPNIMTPEEQQELYAEVVILEQHLHGKPKLLWHESKTNKKTGKFVRSRKAVSVEYLVQDAWGKSKNYFKRLRMKRDDAEAALHVLDNINTSFATC